MGEEKTNVFFEGLCFRFMVKRRKKKHLSTNCKAALLTDDGVNFPYLGISLFTPDGTFGLKAGEDSLDISMSNICLYRVPLLHLSA